MPFTPLRKRALPELQAQGCDSCKKTDEVLYHFTSSGGIKQSEIINHSDGYREKAFSKVQDFSPKAFCSFSCFERDEAKKLPALKWKPKRPF